MSCTTPFLTPRSSASRAISSASASRVGAGLLAIDMLAGIDRLPDQCGAHLRCAGVEENLVLWIGECSIEIRGPALDLVPLCQRLQLVGVPADEYRVGNDNVAVGESQAAVRADGEDRADEVLVGAHPASDAVHDDSEAASSHVDLRPWQRTSYGSISNRMVTRQASRPGVRCRRDRSQGLCMRIAEGKWHGR